MLLYSFHRQWKIAVLVLTIAAIFVSCENDIKEIQSFEDTQNLPIQTAEKIEIIYSDSARVKLKLYADLMERFVNPETGNYILFNEGIHVQFFNQFKQVETDLKANKAKHLESEDIWEVSDNVVVINKKGEIINSELLIWDRKEGKIHSDKYVKITTPDEIIMGDGFESDEQFMNYVIFKSHGIINLHQTE
jgi:LPS export ABC transporter protein LptC